MNIGIVVSDQEALSNVREAVRGPNDRDAWTSVKTRVIGREIVSKEMEISVKCW